MEINLLIGFTLLQLFFFPFLIILILYLSFILIYSSFKLSRGPSLTEDWKGAILGHRGCRVNNMSPSALLAPPLDYNIPENSLLAMAWAYDHGADGVEVDVQTSSDKVAFVLHDDTLHRTHQSQGPVNPPVSSSLVSSLTIEEIQKTKWKNVGSVEYVPREEGDLFTVDAAAPTLEETLRFCKRKNLKLMIELKEAYDPVSLRKRIIELYQKLKISSKDAFVASFNPVQLYFLRAEAPYISTCFLYSRKCIQNYHDEGSTHMQPYTLINFKPIRMMMDWFLSYGYYIVTDFIGASIIGPHNILVSGEVLSFCALQNLSVYVWVVNDLIESRYLRSKGCIIGTDRTDVLLQKST